MKSILIVEDEESLLQLYRMELEEEGYKVSTASNGTEALKIMQENPADIVLLDLALPDGSGLDFMTRMLEFNPKVKIVINTAFPEYHAEFQPWSATAVLLKSSDLSELKKAVRELLKDKPE